MGDVGGMFVGGGGCNDVKILDNDVVVGDVWCWCGDWGCGWEWRIEDVYFWGVW